LQKRGPNLVDRHAKYTNFFNSVIDVVALKSAIDVLALNS